MLSQIITNTPLWVWALLGFLLYRGIVASKDRIVSVRSIFVIPIVMLCLSLQDMTNNFGFSTTVLISWGISYVLITALIWKQVAITKASIKRPDSQVFLRGSWLPLVMMMAIFIIKYCLNVMLAIAPQWKSEGVFVVIVCVLLGILNGILMGKMLGLLQLYRAEPASSSATFPQSL